MYQLRVYLSALLIMVYYFFISHVQSSSHVSIPDLPDDEDAIQAENDLLHGAQATTTTTSLRTFSSTFPTSPTTPPPQSTEEEEAETTMDKDWGLYNVDHEITLQSGSRSTDGSEDDDDDEVDYYDMFEDRGMVIMFTYSGFISTVIIIFCINSWIDHTYCHQVLLLNCLLKPFH